MSLKAARNAKSSCYFCKQIGYLHPRGCRRGSCRRSRSPRRDSSHRGDAISHADSVVESPAPEDAAATYVVHGRECTCADDEVGSACITVLCTQTRAVQEGQYVYVVDLPTDAATKAVAVCGVVDFFEEDLVHIKFPGSDTFGYKIYMIDTIRIDEAERALQSDIHPDIAGDAFAYWSIRACEASWYPFMERRDRKGELSL